jgi:hypothetical protein
MGMFKSKEKYSLSKNNSRSIVPLNLTCKRILVAPHNFNCLFFKIKMHVIILISMCDLIVL